MRLPRVIWDLSMITGPALMACYGALQILAEGRVLIAMKGPRK